MNIRKIIIYTLLVSTTVACGNRDQQEAIDTQIKAIIESNYSLKKEIESRDSIMNDALYIISDISATLSQIKAREGAVINRAETGKITKVQIKEDLEYIAKALESKNRALATLDASLAKLKAANVKIDGLNLLIKQLQDELDERNKTISMLINNIDDLESQIEIINNDIKGLNDDNKQLEQLLMENQKEMNRAYYIVGSQEELIEKGIITKEGVIGRTLVTNPNVDKSLLIEVDITKLDKIEIKASKVDIIGEFPENSYTLATGEKKKDIETLYIDNKEEFWKDSKILIITYKK